jgi:uncharacterized protein (DUF3084 family)
VQLSDEGINAVGIRHIIQMRVHVRVLQGEVEEARQAQQLAEADRDQAKEALQEARERSPETNRQSKPSGGD